MLYDEIIVILFGTYWFGNTRGQAQKPVQDPADISAQVFLRCNPDFVIC